MLLYVGGLMLYVTVSNRDICGLTWPKLISIKFGRYNIEIKHSNFVAIKNSNIANISKGYETATMTCLVLPTNNNLIQQPLTACYML